MREEYLGGSQSFLDSARKEIVRSHLVIRVDGNDSLSSSVKRKAMEDESACADATFVVCGFRKNLASPAIDEEIELFSYRREETTDLRS
jgi:hypothetical protein